MKPQWKDRASAGSSDTAVKLQPPLPTPALPVGLIFLGLGFLVSVRNVARLSEADNPCDSFTHSHTANLAPAAEPRVALALLSAPSMDPIH